MQEEKEVLFLEEDLYKENTKMNNIIVTFMLCTQILSQDKVDSHKNSHFLKSILDIIECN